MLAWLHRRKRKDRRRGRPGVINAQTILAAVEIVVAVVMAVTAWFAYQNLRSSRDQIEQGRQDLELTRTQIDSSTSQGRQSLQMMWRQIESSIQPRLDAWVSGGEVHLRNTGTVTIAQVQLLARLEREFPAQTSGVRRPRFSTPQHALADTLRPGQGVWVDLGRYGVADHDTTREDGRKYLLVPTCRRKHTNTAEEKAHLLGLRQPVPHT